MSKKRKRLNKNKIIFCIFLICSSPILLLEKDTSIKSINEGWIKYKDNPVLGNKKTGTLFDPFVFKQDDLYKMYVSWRPKGGIALSKSKNGFNWSKLKMVLNPGNSDSWDCVINRGSLVIYNNKYYLWYTGQKNQISKIGLAISEDGYKFRKYANNPILIPEFDYEYISVMNPHVICDNDEKIFKMWYAGGEHIEPDVICYATSTDGINWIKYKKNPIFFKNEDKTFLDWYKVGGCDVHKISKNKYLMFYIGYSALETARIFIAESEDGINNWKRNNNPIIQPSLNEFDSDSCYKPSAIYDKEKNRWILWYNGRNKIDEYIGVATKKITKNF